ncbi:MAG: alpha/beta hydrolase [Steroidobacteraceae bacterium]
MNPFYFGTSGRRLFGIHAAARQGAPRSAVRAVLLCPPWGQEYLRVHRSMRHLADLLAAAGCDVLRFDYFGTGDSAGDVQDGSVAGWESDIDTAIDELKDLSGANKVALVGLRLGALLAARVQSRRGRDLSALVLWDPVLSGTQFLEELFRTARTREHPAERPRPRPEEQGGGHEVMGFVLPKRLVAEIRELELAPLAKSWPDRAHLVVSQGPAAANELRQALALVPSATRLAEIPARPPWIETDQIMAGDIPINVLRHIVGVLRDGAPA